MSISKAKVVPEIGSMAVLCLLLGLLSMMFPPRAAACSCNWRGPFLTVTRDAPLVVRGLWHPIRKRRLSGDRMDEILGNT
jgi:hypothetical protein